jgi:D-alanyl-lipoteichoic acid acyltransferase DltB (MBOAT superfamily)
MATMLLGGLWHGAGWTFVFWGGLHGLYLIGERGARRAFGSPAWAGRLPGRYALALLTYGLVCFTWVFFRAGDFGSAWHILTAMVVGGPGTVYVGLANALNIAVLTLMVLWVHWYMRDRTVEDVVQRIPWWARSAGLAFMLFWLINETGGGHAFIYFQF